MSYELFGLFVTELGLIIMENNKIFKILLNQSCKISTFNFCFLSSVILHKLSTTVSSDQYNFGLIRN